MADNPDIGRGAKLDGKLNPIEPHPLAHQLHIAIEITHLKYSRARATGPFANEQAAIDWVQARPITELYLILPLTSHLRGHNAG